MPPTYGRPGSGPSRPAPHPGCGFSTGRVRLVADARPPGRSQAVAMTENPPHRPLLLCYDGSQDAKRAISRAAELFAARSAVVIAVWQPVSALVAYGWAGVSALGDDSGLDDASQQATSRLADEGAELARAAGLAADPQPVEAGWSVWTSIL